jgi:hypothetical protein
MKAKLIKSIKLDAMQKADSKYQQKINISSKFDFMPLINQSCHYNSVHAVKAGKAAAVIECVTIGNTCTTAHYISQLEDGSYVDYTLGWSWSGDDYRFIRIVPESEYGCIYDSLHQLKEKLCASSIGRIAKILSIEPGDIC